MNLIQAHDFLQECEALHDIVNRIDDADFDLPTQFKSWTINDVLVHLDFWNQAVDLALQDREAFGDFATSVFAEIEQHGHFKHLENRKILLRGRALCEDWMARARDIAARWRELDPKTRIPWVGPDMSARSAMTARQMETWAHGFEIFDALGKQRSEADRIRNIVMLGINTYAWSQQLHGLTVAAAMPRLTLTAPSGEVWEFGESDSDHITGDAVDFAAVVTQTRAVDDTDLEITGEDAERWMRNAQCFVGTPGTQPKAGTRFRS